MPQGNHTHFTSTNVICFSFASWVSLITGLEYGMEWNGTIRKSEIMKYTFFSHSSIALQEVILHRVTGC